MERIKSMIFKNFFEIKANRIQTEGAHRFSRNNDTHHSYPAFTSKHILVKMLQFEYKEKILELGRREKLCFLLVWNMKLDLTLHRNIQQRHLSYLKYTREEDNVMQEFYNQLSYLLIIKKMFENIKVKYKLIILMNNKFWISWGRKRHRWG